MNQTYSAGGIIINKCNEVLLINEGDGFWGFPKGRIENKEEVLATALREIKEETGYTNIELIKELGTYQRHPVNAGIEDPSELMNITLFLFQTNDGVPVSNDEDNECAWFSVGNAPDKFSHPRDKEFFKQVMAELPCY